MSLSLRTRLAAISVVVFGLLITVLSGVSYSVFARGLDRDVTDHLTELTDGLHGYLRFDGAAASVSYDASDNDQAAFVHEATRYYQVYDASTGQELAESSGIAPLALHLTPGEVQAFQQNPRPFDIETEYGRIRFSNSVGASPDGRRYLLQVGVPLGPRDAALARYRTVQLTRVPLALLVAVAASWWLSRFALAPIARLAEAARAIDVETLERRLPGRGVGDELDQVVTAFNETLERLERAVGEMRQFSAALAHELRTPLAALRGEIELAALEAAPDAAPDRLASQMEEIDRLTRLIDHILTLARAEAGQIRLRRLPVDMSALVASLVDQLEPIADARAVRLESRPSDEVVVMGDEGWLRRLLINLLDNAIKYTPPDGRVVVSVAREGEEARIDVRDTGIGLTPEDAQQVFERFFRADRARSSSNQGAGLGLALVQWIAAQHGGRVTVSSMLGKGSTFTVRLPLHRG